MTTAVEDLDTPDVLRRAADLLESEGWTQGRYRRADGSRCAEIAIMDASLRWADEDAAIAAVVEHLDLRTAHTPRLALERWNDESYRTRDEVLAALRETAEAVDAR